WEAGGAHELGLGCAAGRRGREASGEWKVAALAREVERLKQELARYQSLLRLTQRSVGVSPAAPPAKAAGGKRERKPLVRALRRAERLRAGAEGGVGAGAARAGTGWGHGSGPGQHAGPGRDTTPGAAAQPGRSRSCADDMRRGRRSPTRWTGPSMPARACAWCWK